MRLLFGTILFGILYSSFIFLMFLWMDTAEAQDEVFFERCSCHCQVENNPSDACGGPQQFKNNTLWKPQGENNGNLVVLIAESYPEFASCDVKKRDGSWEQMIYTGRSNGNRQTFRGSKPGGPYYAGKLGEGGVLCFLPNAGGFCEFLLPGAPKRRHE